MLEQFLGLPGSTTSAQVQDQLCGIQGRAEQQGPKQNERFQMIAVMLISKFVSLRLTRSNTALLGSLLLLEGWHTGAGPGSEPEHKFKTAL